MEWCYCGCSQAPPQKSGLFFGLGFAIAHKVVNDVMVPQYKVCGYQLERLKDCLDNYERDISKCQLYMDKLHECCKRN
ncbi:hypothetical protein Q3G72_020830 [Acer saccharum]|nr:hypothetical protein Q3G72_020830 [Acer saccharum]